MPVMLFAYVKNIGLELLLSAQAGFAVLQGAANYHTGGPQHQERAALCQKQVRTHLRRAALTIISAVRCNQPKVWSNSGSGFGSEHFHFSGLG